MKLDDIQESRNVEDRRAGGGARRGGAGRSIRLSGGVIVAVLVVSAVTRQNPLRLLASLTQTGPPPASAPPSTRPPANDRSARFVAKVLKTTEDTWGRLSPSYRPPKLVLFRDRVDSACGHATAAVGPFYCPGDHKAYLDLTFFDDLAAKFGAPGDFAAAYVVAHEVGHHVQNLMGTSAKVNRSGDHQGATSLGVRLELQADCYAGVWAADAQRRGLLETGDVEEALRAAHEIGDDTLQRRGRGRVSPDSFTHGSAAQRERWFKLGMQTGDPRRCDTFAAATL